MATKTTKKTTTTAKGKTTKASSEDVAAAASSDDLALVTSGLGVLQEIADGVKPIVRLLGDIAGALKPSDGVRQSSILLTDPLSELVGRMDKVANEIDELPSRRELFAAIAMHGLIVSQGGSTALSNPDALAAQASTLGDALCIEMERNRDARRREHYQRQAAAIRKSREEHEREKVQRGQAGPDAVKVD